MRSEQKLDAVIAKYSSHPEFLGIQILDVNQRGSVDDTLLHLAARTGALEDLETLLEAGANVNLQGDLGNTALHQAAMTGEILATKRLLEAGADSRIRNEFEQTPLDVARIAGHPDVEELLKSR